MDRRLLVFPGTLLLVLAVLGAVPTVGHGEGYIYAERDPNAGETGVPVDSLAPPCREVADSLAAGRNVSFEIYEVETAGMTVTLRRTGSDGWAVLRGEPNCYSELVDSDLEVDGRFYEVYGRSSPRGGVSGLPVLLVEFLLGAVGLYLLVLGSLHFGDRLP